MGQPRRACRCTGFLAQQKGASDAARNEYVGMHINNAQHGTLDKDERSINIALASTCR